MDRRTKITYIKYIIAKTIAAAVFLGTLHIAHVAWFLFFSPNALLRRDRDRSRRGLRGVVRGRQVRWRNVRPVPFKGFGDERRPSARPSPSPKRRTIATDSEPEREAVAV